MLKIVYTKPWILLIHVYERLLLHTNSFKPLTTPKDSTPPIHSPIETNVKWVLHKAHLHVYAATGGFNLRFSLNLMIFVIIKVQNLYRVILKVPRNKTLNLDYWYSALIF